MTRQEFIDLLMPHALEASRRTGVDPRIIIAQAAQETGWGRSAPGNNFFGIKSHGQGGGNTFSTTEYVNGQPVRINDSFRSYESPAASVAGYADFLLANPRYRAMMQAQGIDAQLEALGRSGYATDPNYASSVGSIARSIIVPGGAQAMAYTAPAATPAGQSAINAATGPAAGLPAPAPAPGSQRLFRPRSEAIAAREAGGTPRLDEISNIIRQRRMGDRPLLERLQNFIQTRREARQAEQTPTPPAPVGTGSGSGGGGGGGGGDPQVLALQQQLQAAGFDPGPLDGIMGPRTRAAMAAMQAAQATQPPVPAPNPMRGPPPLPNPRPGPMAPPAQANLNYNIPVGTASPQQIAAPAPGSLTTGSLTPVAGSGQPSAAEAWLAQSRALEQGLAQQQATEPQRIAAVDEAWRRRDAMAPDMWQGRQGASYRPSLGPLIAAATPPPAPAPMGGILPPTQGPGTGGRPVTTTVGQVAPDQQWGVNNGLMPAFRNDFGAMNRLPTFGEQNPYTIRPQGPEFRREVQATTPPGSSMLPLRTSWPIPSWWRQLMGAGV